MRISVSRHLSGRLVCKAMMTVAAAALLAGCSNSIERFQNAYSNPSDADPVYTASVPKSVRKPVQQRQAYAEPQVSDEETISESPVTRAPLPRASTTPQYDYTENYKKSYKQPAMPAAKPRYNAQSYDDADIAQGETEITPAPKPRKRIVMDESETEITPVSKPRRVAAVQQDETDITPARKSTGSASRHTVTNGETLYSLGRKYGVSPFVIADANGLDHNTSLRIGQQIRIPASASRLAVKETPDKETAPAPVAQPTKKKRAVLSLAEDENQTDDSASADAGTSGDDLPAQTGNLKLKPKAQAAAAEPVDEEKVAELPAPAPATGQLNMRWPLKGKVISEFGPKANGLKNEGINIAVPEGTSIRAAEGGVVAYAGNELKGYGNLVLIRHAGGYVTAYAHAKEILVKRGDTVKRGDVIAKAGQTGAVSSPQLHFEVRKGATALDPMKHLSSATAMN
ncbi:MAG: M23 family metallopeptidase [Rhizobiales bacterium]|nr:M23 family metallopeptidase [Hyphomicrobiales bacterium]